MNTKVKDKLSKIMARLASDQDGEVLNAARLMVRILAAEGKRPRGSPRYGRGAFLPSERPAAGL